jgi:C6 transcription factor Pro1
VNDIPTRCDTSTSSFSTFAPPQLESTLPQLPSDDWMPAIPMTQQSLEQCEMQDSSLSSGSPQQSFALMQTSIPVDDCDRPLLNYFVDNVLRLIFPVLETHQKSHERAQAVLQSIETNKSYLHCCLSVAALHFKSTAGNSGDDIDHDIVRHRFDAISHLCQALNSDTEHDRILEATLAMIFFHCSVGGPDEYLPDIPWNDHFQAATNLIHRLDLPATLINCTSSLSPPPFNMTLASWIDILGATMLGKAPQFAHTYRTKHLSGTPSGLRELMGCDDRVMYLISEIACLDALKSEGLIDDIAVCGHVSALAQQLEFTEPADNRIEQPYSTSGVIKPDQLTNNMTAIFRIAARIYLCTLVPGFDRNQPSNINLVEAVCKVLDYIPTGPGGYDRSLVWPLLITGAYASPATSFRRTLESRIISMGDEADFGSFGRMYRLLQEVWRLSDDPFSPVFALDGSSDPESFTSSQALDPIYSPPLGSAGMRELKKRDVHWREVMFRNGWRYLLI